MAHFRVIDADGHVTERNDQLMPYVTGHETARGSWAARSVHYPDDSWDRSLGGKLGTRASDAATWSGALDDGGMDLAVLYPTDGLGIGWLREPDAAIALARAWNDFFFHEFYQRDKRLLGVALVAPHDPVEAVKEMRRAMTELHMAGVMLPAVGCRLPLGHPSLDPIYAEAERLGAMIGVHATVRGPHTFGADMFDSFIEVHTMSHPVGQMAQITSMVFGGVPEKFPNLRIAYLEAGCTWVPYWANRMDEEFEKRGEVEAPLLKRKPSEYIRGGKLYFPVEDGESLVAPVADFLGHNQLFYASDFPHWDNSFPHSIQSLSERQDLTEELKQKILADNSERLYGLESSRS